VIFVTVGSQMPFDRLIQAMDTWAAEHPEYLVEAQIGNSTYVPKAMTPHVSLPPTLFIKKMAEAEVVVAHAGMGNIINAAEHRKPLVLMPRRGALRETRNDHQVATARWLKEKPGIFVADSEAELPQAISEALAASGELALPNRNPLPMINRLRQLIHAL